MTIRIKGYTLAYHYRNLKEAVKTVRYCFELCATLRQIRMSLAYKSKNEFSVSDRQTLKLINDLLIKIDRGGV